MGREHHSRTSADPAARVTDLVAPLVHDLGYEVWRVHFGGGRGTPTLQIMVERRDGAPMVVDDCVAVSQTLSPVLDVADVVPGAYVLEVSSPGMDRPLVTPSHFARCRGERARIELMAARDGRKRFQGVIAGTTDDVVLLQAGDDNETREIALPFAEIAKARLMLPDEYAAPAGKGPKRRGKKRQGG